MKFSQISPNAIATAVVAAIAALSAGQAMAKSDDASTALPASLPTKPGGGMTMKRISTRSYIFPGESVKGKAKLDFWTGFSLFRDPWVIAPSSTKDRDGLGPLFNARSCVACHQGGSRGKMSQHGEHLPTSLLIRLGPIADRYATEKYTDGHNYGGQIQPRAIKFNHGRLEKSPVGEAWLNLSYKTIDGEYADGTPYQLQKPSYQLTRLAYGEISEGIAPSPRFSPNVFGAGLLDAISEQDLLAQEDADDTNGDGISPRYNRVADHVNGSKGVGRFGLKAKHPSLKQQVVAAFRDDIGITNNVFPQESCEPAQLECFAASKLGGHTSVEIPDKLVNLVMAFSQHLGVPPTRNPQSLRALKGRQLFNQLGCASCHTPSYTTASNYPDNNLANQTIWPYTNLALHDMGEGLADGAMEGQATGREWRTPPLWGIGLQQAVLGEARYLHDGRARSIEEAVLWHGGEARPAQQKFKQLSAQERNALLTFLHSI
ncbi:di-heme oxidoreductase family protein [Thalassotalea euphylliae]|uniref:Cytochrome c domain-containing protein n=1 Tax=Thalassotalea euphylliae TaxID=1655234 RepID=A0A3E0U5H1_9GAMM|nr:di-heme oxidoredictase family protein [Thalassotalea euphylliae]REL32196.1 hypothetical protein DXX94_16540 [Thalassotalea euphylliae]